MQSTDGVDIRLGGIETMSLRANDAESRNCLLLLFREFALRFCESKALRWSGDTQAMLRVRVALAADERSQDGGCSRRCQQGTASALVPFAANLSVARGQ